MTQVSLSHLRHLIRTLSYVVSTRAADELEDDNLSIFDLENAQAVVKVGHSGKLIVIPVYAC